LVGFRAGPQTIHFSEDLTFRNEEMAQPPPQPPAYPTYLDSIGKTPLVRIDRMLPEAAKHATVLVKLEMQNPGGSIKDRIALQMIESAEKAGLLKPGMTVVEATSGNTGIGIAMVCAAKGYACIIIMPQVPAMLERVMIIRQFGGEVRLTAPGFGIKGSLEHYEAILASDPSKYFGTAQFTNLSNPEAHYLTTGPEIWEQTAGQVDVFIHGIGTGGCISGAGKFLKEKKPSVQVVAIEPEEARVHLGAPMKPHPIVGIGAGLVTHFLGMEGKALDGVGEDGKGTPLPGVIDEWACASGAECVEYAKKAAMQEGIMCGPSAGAALKVALQVASRPESAGKTIVVILASHGIRYTAHPLWAAVKAQAVPALPAPPDMSKEGELLRATLA
jgi:cysteine synthase